MNAHRILFLTFSSLVLFSCGTKKNEERNNLSIGEEIHHNQNLRENSLIELKNKIQINNNKIKLVNQRLTYSEGDYPIWGYTPENKERLINFHKALIEQNKFINETINNCSKTNDEKNFYDCDTSKISPLVDELIRPDTYYTNLEKWGIDFYAYPVKNQNSSFLLSITLSESPTEGKNFKFFNFNDDLTLKDEIIYFKKRVIGSLKFARTSFTYSICENSSLNCVFRIYQNNQGKQVAEIIFLDEENFDHKHQYISENEPCKSFVDYLYNKNIIEKYDYDLNLKLQTIPMLKNIDITEGISQEHPFVRCK